MDLIRIVIFTISVAVVNANINNSDIISDEMKDGDIDNSADAFKGVYTECLFSLSFSCLQKKTLVYLKALNNLSEVSVIGDYVKFVKLNVTDIEPNTIEETEMKSNSDELSLDIDNAVNKFFDNHILRFKALGKDISMSRTVDEFVGRKKRKGGGGGGGGHDDGKKKMMMMAMMCMKMKMMMMIPAMMGMMGMMSFKGMMFSMMSFMISKMMLLMKLLEKKGGSGGGSGGGGGGDGWAAGGGGGAWMPAGGQDYGGGGGYDANGQWQSRSIIENTERNEDTPVISYVTPLIRYNNNANGKKPYSLIKNLNDEIVKVNNEGKSRKKRGIIDVLQNTYLYWVNQVLGGRYKNKLNYPKYKIINGVKYVYYPLRYIQKAKKPKALNNDVKTEGVKTVITAEDFNKGEIVEGPVESRMHKKKFMKMKDSVTETVDDNPWE